MTAPEVHQAKCAFCAGTRFFVYTELATGELLLTCMGCGGMGVPGADPKAAS